MRSQAAAGAAMGGTAVGAAAAASVSTEQSNGAAVATATTMVAVGGGNGTGGAGGRDWGTRPKVQSPYCKQLDSQHKPRQINSVLNKPIFTSKKVTRFQLLQ